MNEYDNRFYELYMHHGRQAWVRKDLKGKHREHCLCYSCDKFHPGSDEWEKNCPLANLIYSLCRANKVLLPVWECEQFVEKEGEGTECKSMVAYDIKRCFHKPGR